MPCPSTCDRSKETTQGALVGKCIQSLTNDARRRADELATDTKANGLLHPSYWMRDDTSIDGRNRLETCKRAKVEPKFETLNGSDAQATRERSINLSDRSGG